MPLNGIASKRRVLVVEDESLVAMLLDDMLAELGFTAVAIAARLEDAMNVARSRDFDLAILDVNLNGARSYAVADLLKDRGIPVIFATGYGAKGIDPAYAELITIQKPFRRDDLEDAIARALSRGGEQER